MTEKENERPSLPEKAKNLAKFSWDLIKYINSNHGKSVVVSEEIYKERISTCRSCPKYMEVENECAECGCYLPAKAKIILDSCPLGKWKELNEEWEEVFGKIIEDLDKEEKTE